MNGRARLIDVANASGVTKSVASRVLNDDSSLRVRPETRRRIWAAAATLGYRPHAGARALASAQARALALLIPNLDNPAHSRVIRGAYRRAQELGFVVLLAEDPADYDAQESFAELVEAGRVDGLLIASARSGHPLIGSPRLASVPHVFVNRRVDGSGRNITVDAESASAAAVGHLFDLGHRRIGYVSGPEGLEPSASRERGFVSTMTKLSLDAGRIQRSRHTEEGGASATRELLARWPDTTALYVTTLYQAVGVLHASHEMGRRVPDDLSVIAYDDLPLAGYLCPPLTTIAMPLGQLGGTAVDALVRQLRGEPAQDVTISEPPVVVARSSTAVAPRRRGA